LCPSFFRAEVISNPSAWDKLKARFRNAVIRMLQRRIDRRLARITSQAA
jgi:indolepyruvate ferredoxin oxidoreductase alpha subunit